MQWKQRSCLVTKVANAVLSAARRSSQFSGYGKVFIGYRQNGHTINRWGIYEKLSRPSTQENRRMGSWFIGTMFQSMLSVAVNVALNVALNWLITVPILIWPHLPIISSQAQKEKLDSEAVSQWGCHLLLMPFLPNRMTASSAMGTKHYNTDGRHVYPTRGYVEK